MASLLAGSKPRVMALLCLLAVAGAALSPHFLSPLFPVGPLGQTAPFLWLGARLPALFSPPIWSVAHALGAALVTALVWSATALINDVADDAIDRIANPDRPVAAGRLSRETALRWAAGMQVTALALTYTAGSLTAVALVAGGALLGSAYSLPPLRLRNNGLTANLIIGAGVFLAVTGGAVAQYRLTAGVVTSAAVLGLLAFAASMVKDFNLCCERPHREVVSHG